MHGCQSRDTFMRQHLPVGTFKSGETTATSHDGAKSSSRQKLHHFRAKRTSHRRSTHQPLQPLFLESELLDVIKRNLKESDELDKEQTPLASILNEVINEYKVKPTLSEEGDGIYKVIIPIPKQLISQVKLSIMDMLKHY